VPGEYLLPGLLAGFHAAHPAVRARLRISDTAATIDQVRQGEIQLGMVGGTTADDDLVFEPFARDSLVLAVPARSPWTDRGEISIRQLQQLPLLLREPGSGTRKVLEEALARRKVAASSLQIVAELGSTSAIKEGIKQGHGASFVSALAIATERAAGLLRVVRVRAFGPLQRTYSTVVDRRRVLSPVTRSFKDYLASRYH
jgi:DNA-binding transcriptional LysR family regulator